MVEAIFAELAEAYGSERVEAPVSYYFSLGESKKTVILTPENCSVADGKTVDNADCVCKTSPEFFTRIWVEGYRPGMKDFLSGTIKSNDPQALLRFLRCFGKEA